MYIWFSQNSFKPVEYQQKRTTWIKLRMTAACYSFNGDLGALFFLGFLYSLKSKIQTSDYQPVIKHAGDG